MNLGALIPQLFYDLIGRVIPGGFLLFGLSLALELDPFFFLGPFLTAPPFAESSLFLIGLVLAASFLAGHVIRPLSNLFQWATEKFAYQSFHVVRGVLAGDDLPLEMRRFAVRELGYDNLEDVAADETMSFKQAIHIWADWLRLVDPLAGDRIVKLRAERRMHAAVGAAGLLILLVHSVAAASGTVEFHAFFAAVQAFIAVLSGFNLAWASKIFQWSVLNNLYAKKAIGGGSVPASPSRD